MPQTDPINTMILNFVDKLKIIGAQLVQKSTRSPNMSLQHNFTPETLNAYHKSMTSSLDIAGGTSEYLHDSTPARTSKQTPEKALKIPMPLLESMVSAASSIDHADEDLSGDDENQAFNQDDSNMSGANDEDDEPDEPDIDCFSKDCVDIVPVETNNISSNNNNLPQETTANTVVTQQYHSNTPPKFDQPTETFDGLGPVINGNVRQPSFPLETPFQIPQDPIIKNNLLDNNYDNALGEENQERQTSSAFGSYDSIRGNNLFGWLICLLLIATKVIISTNELSLVKPNVVVVAIT